MPSKRQVFDALTRNELLDIAERFELEVADRRVRDQLVDAATSSRRVGLHDVLRDLSRDRLKEICRALDLDDGGREKHLLVERLTGSRPSAAPASKSNGAPTAGGAEPQVEVEPGAKLTTNKLEQYLWSAADILRGSIDSSDYKGFIFGLLFLKRLSDRFDEECDALRSQAHADPDDPDEHDFFVPKRARWAEIQRVATGVGEALNKACAELEQKNDKLEGVLAGIDFNDERKLGDAKNRDSVLSRLVQHFARLDLRNANLSEPDMLGRAYEYLIERFADDAGKKGGEFYTPRMVVRLIVEILEPKEGMRVCDPTCGSGGMLIECAHHLGRHGQNPRNLSLFGQEKNLGTWAICRMNTLLHGLPDADIRKGDTIRDPKLVTDGELMLFDRVIANPPFGLDEWGQEIAEHDRFERFSLGVPPKGKGELAFVQHMVATTNSKGMVGVVMPHGVLFRTGSEADIRRGWLQEDLIEAVIGLPTDLFYGAGIPAAILVFNRAKSPGRHGRVLFIDASKEFRQGTNQNFLRDADVAHMARAFQAFRDEPGYAKVVPVAEVASGAYDLTVSRQVGASEAATVPDLWDSIEALRERGRVLGELEMRLADLLARVEDRTGAPPKDWRDRTYGDVMVETDQRAGERTSLPVLSVTKRRGPMLASERFSKTMHGRNLSRYRVAERGQIVADPMLLWDGSIGMQQVVDAGLVSPDYRVYRAIEDVEPAFLGFAVRSPHVLPHYQGGARGTNVRRNRISRDAFLAIPIALPEKEEQREIVEALTCVDQTIEAAERLLEQLQSTKRALTASLVTGDARIGRSRTE